MTLPTPLLFFILSLIAISSAQFQFFEQMFTGNQPQQQPQQQNVASDSSWYRKTYDGGNQFFPPPPPFPFLFSTPSLFPFLSNPPEAAAANSHQHTAQTTSAHKRLHACISPTTARAHSPLRRISLNWAMAAPCAYPRADGVRARRGERWS